MSKDKALSGLNKSEEQPRYVSSRVRKGLMRVAIVTAGMLPASTGAGAQYYQLPPTGGEASTAACDPPSRDAFACINYLSDQAKQATGNDEANYYYFDDPILIAHNMQKQCPMDTPTSFNVSEKGRRIRVTLNLVDGRDERSFAARRATTTDPDTIMAAGAVIDCTLVNKEELKVMPMLRKSKKAKFQPFGRAAITKSKDGMEITGYASSRSHPSPYIPEQYTAKGTVQTKYRVTSRQRKQGLFGVKIMQKYGTLEPTYGQEKGFWNRVYVVKRLKKKTNPNAVTVQSTSKNVH